MRRVKPARSGADSPQGTNMVAGGRPAGTKRDTGKNEGSREAEARVPGASRGAGGSFESLGAGP